MKNIVIVMLFSSFLTVHAQSIEPPSEGKSVVYFVRVSTLGFAINFSYFDNDRFIGKFNAPKYLRYECEPGEHIFWGKSENRDFVNAKLEADKVYFIEAVPQMGGLKTQLQLVPIQGPGDKRMEKILKLLEKKIGEVFTPEALEAETVLLSKDIETGLAKYQEALQKGNKILTLDPGMFIPTGEQEQ